MSTRIGRPSTDAPASELGTDPTLAGDTGRDPTLAAPSSRDTDYAELVRVDPAHYVLGGEIARGGMGRILSARDRRLGRTIAIKEIAVTSGDLRARFEREARITARLQHPSIVSIHEAGTWPSGAPFYAMKLVAGESLDKAIAARPTARKRLELLPNAIAAVDALAYAHHEGVIHRDLKPANVLVGEYGETVVIDWGLAKELGSEDAPDVGPYRTAAGADQTVAGSVMGTPAYMPVEQARGETVDERADVYALGALLYHLLAGRPPYSGSSAQAILDKVLAGAPAPLDQPDVAVELIAIVSKAMAYRAEDRYATAGELAIDLKRFQAGQLVGAHRYTTGELVRRWLRKHRTAVIAGALALVVIAIVGVIAIRNVIDERDRADEALHETEAARAEAVVKQKEAVTNANRAIVEQARAALDRDPAEALALLKQLSADAPLSGARVIAADTLSRSPAREIWRGHLQIPNGVVVSPDGAWVASWDRNAVWVWSRRGAAATTHAWTDVSRVRFCDDNRLIAQTTNEVFSFDPHTAKTASDRGAEMQLLLARCNAEDRTFHFTATVTTTGTTGTASWKLNSNKWLTLHYDPATVSTREIGMLDGELEGAADGDHVVVLRDGVGEVVSASTGTRRALGKLGGEAIAMSRDASVVVSSGTKVVLHGATNRELAWEPRSDIAVSPDGRLVAQATPQRLEVLEVATGKEIPFLRSPSQPLRTAFSPDGNWLAIAGDTALRVYETARWTSIDLSANGVTSFAFTRDSRSIVVALMDRTIREWPLATRTPISNDATAINFAATLADGALAVASPLRVGTRELAKVAHRPAISADRRALAWVNDEGTWRWRIGGVPQRIGDLTKARGIAVQGETVAVFHDDACTILGTTPTTIALGADTPSTMALPRADGSWIAPLPDQLGIARVWRPTITTSRAQSNVESFAPAIALSARGTWAAVARSHNSNACIARVRLVDVAAAKDRELPDACGLRPAFSPDERWLATSSPRGEILLWDVATPGAKRTLSPAIASPFSLAFSPDGRWLAAGGAGVIVVFDVTGGTAPRRLDGFIGVVTTLVFSDDSASLIATPMSGVWLWSLADGIGRELPSVGSYAHFAEKSIVVWAQRAYRITDDLPVDGRALLAQLQTLPYTMGAAGVTTRD